ncbi:MAG: reverse transcriptase family protein [Candidatus Thiodiazotropha endolucinida]|nr:reverse transcriptase family protein [Candidatus Thiodiazotropha taylori]MCW4263276.1 reverse transcriptase family protein [Candidatus Thiodiazotropha endolucinida]
MTPIYKKGDKTNPANYRPVSLTCICCKLLEHIICSNLMQHLNRNNILYPMQHGFREKRSCETQLIEFVHDIAFNMQKGIQNDVVVMDFAKAFDKVAHNRLLYKLSSYGVKGNTLGWIGSFLGGRSQRVVLEGKSSSSVPVLSGVPQGSVLGPILFLTYINDLPEYVTNSTVRLFADDTLLYLAIHNSSDCTKLQKDLKSLERWESDWQMAFHPEKCEVIHITSKKEPVKHTYSLHGHTLSSVPQIKYLGVNISEDLKWNTHINSATSKANQTLGFLKRNLQINSSTVKDKAYKSLVRPKLEYCNTVWDPKCTNSTKEGEKSSHRLVDQLEMVQRRAARWVTGRYHNTSHVTDMLHSLDWRTLEQRRVDSRLCMLYKIRNRLVAIEEEDYLQRGTGRREHQYKQIRADKDYTRFSFFPRTIIQWNKLPAHTCTADSLDTFKTQVAKIEHSRLN